MRRRADSLRTYQVKYGPANEKTRFAAERLGPSVRRSARYPRAAQSLPRNALHVPFSGGPPIMNAVIGGQVQFSLLPAVTVMPMVQSGKLKAIAMSSAKRSPLAPELASMEEIGARGVNIEVWNAIMAQARMPAAHQARLNTELANILNGREMRQKLFVQGWKVEDTSAAALAQRIKSDTAVYSGVIARKGIRLDSGRKRTRL